MTFSVVDFTWRYMHDFVNGRFYWEVHACHFQW